MPGTYVHDSIAPTLHSAIAQTGANVTTTGTGVQVNYPGLVRFKAVNTSLAGTALTVDTEIQGSEDDSTYITIAKFDTLIGTDDAETHWVECYVNSKYVRAVTASTSSSADIAVVGLTVTMEEKHYHRNRTAPSATADSA